MIKRSNHLESRASAAGKRTLTNARTKRQMKIAEDRYAPMAMAITDALEGGRSLPYADLLKSVKQRLPGFPGSIGWYLVTVIRDMESQGRIVCRTSKNRPFYALKAAP